MQEPSSPGFCGEGAVPPGQGAAGGPYLNTHSRRWAETQGWGQGSPKSLLPSLCLRTPGALFSQAFKDSISPEPQGVGSPSWSLPSLRQYSKPAEHSAVVKSHC